MKNVKYVVLSIILTVILTAAFFFSRWIGKETTGFRIPKIIPDLKIGEVHLTRSVAGRTEWELRAKSAGYLKEEDITNLELPRVVLFDQDGNRTELSGDEGKVFIDTNNVMVSGNVNVLYSPGYALHSDMLMYSSNESRISSDSKVIVTGVDFDIEGTGMNADINSGRIRLHKQVKAVLKLSAKGFSINKSQDKAREVH